MFHFLLLMCQVLLLEITSAIKWGVSMCFKKYSLVSQTLAWFNPDPGKIFDDQYSYSSVWYRIIFLVLLCRHPRSSNCVWFGVRFSSTGCSLWFPSVWDIQFTVVLIYPSDLHSLTQEKSKCWFIHCLHPQMDSHLWHVNYCMFVAFTRCHQKGRKHWYVTLVL